MARPPSDVTEAELAVMERLWAEGPLAMKAIAEALYGDSSPSSTSTVQKLLSRLEQKGCVRRDRDQWPHRFTAAIDKETVTARRLQDTADQLYDGSLTPLLTHLVTHGRLTSKDRARVAKLLDELK